MGSSYILLCFYLLKVGYKRIVAFCGGHVINPKCVCAYEMYVLDIFDLCQNLRETARKSGSLYNTDGEHLNYKCSFTYYGYKQFACLG